MKGRSKTQPQVDEQEQLDGVQVNVSANDGVNDGASNGDNVDEQKELDENQDSNKKDAPNPVDGGDKGKKTQKKTVNSKKKDYGDIPEKVILDAIRHNPQYSEFYLNKKGFVFVPGTSKEQMGEDAVLIEVKDFK